MTELTVEEKSFSDWWFSRFDSDYKMIRFYNAGKFVFKYGTMNSRYTDIQDAECAFRVADQTGEKVTCVAVNDSRFKRINGVIRQIADLTEKQKRDLFEKERSHGKADY